MFNQVFSALTFGQLRVGEVIGRNAANRPKVAQKRPFQINYLE